MGIYESPRKISKQKVCDKVIPLSYKSDLLLTERFEMAQHLNGHLGSIITREYTNAVPLPENMFQGKDSEYLGELMMTPSVVTEQIGRMKENKSPYSNKRFN